MSTGGDKLDPDRLESTEFPLVRRGFEPELVRTQLVVVAGEIRRLRNLVAELEGELSSLQARAPDDLEAEKITEAIGEEAVKVLHAAREAATERADRADSEAAEIIAAAEANRERIHNEAETAAEELVEQGRDRGRDMVAEAQTVRERMLRDLAHKRQTHRAEVEQLRAGRDRLLESLVGAQQSLDQSTAELVSAVPEAQAAAERAGLRVSSEPVLTVDQLEAEIATARMIDHPMVDGIRRPMVDDDLAEVDEEDSADLDDLFARLRSSRGDPELDAEPDLPDEIIDLADEPTQELGESAVAEPDVAAPEVVEPDARDADAAACSDAVDEIARSLKRLVVEEQGELLDGIRREGADGLRLGLDDGAAYTGVLVEPLRALAAAVAGEEVEIETVAAEASVQTLLVEPVRSRLRAALDDAGDPAELSITVRAVYRECRSRRVGEAASAAVSAVYEIAVDARDASSA